MSETQNQNARGGSSKITGRSPGGAELKTLTDRARSQTTALLSPIANARIEIRFDLRGKAAGQVRIHAPGRYLIRYNPKLLERCGEEFLNRTVPHEAAHVLAYHHHGTSIRPHGPEWQRIMYQLGAEPTRCHDYDVSGLSTRRLRYYEYHCGCMDHRLSSIRHNKACKGQRYRCRRCGEPLQAGSRSTEF